VIRAKVRRDGPGEWSFVVLDDHGDLFHGFADCWERALRDATRELQAINHEDDRREPAPAPLVCPAVVDRRPWLARLLFGGAR
jgi:hypothetical protein